MWPIPGKDGRFLGRGTWGRVGYDVAGTALPLRRNGEDSLKQKRCCEGQKWELTANIAHFFLLVNCSMFIPYASVYTVSTSAASGLVWKCSLEGQHIFSITAARIVAELRWFVAESFIGADGYHRRKGRNETAHDLFTTARDDWVLLRLGQSRWSVQTRLISYYSPPG